MLQSNEALLVTPFFTIVQRKGREGKERKERKEIRITILFPSPQACGEEVENTVESLS
jgi:hypothetical protein